ncbi:MAG: 5-(carboxyamino)imidazole ribonucleotide synthase [Ignavibacteriales bacterium]|nr:MAG: 5-(carboxyamino)imidazole ribonucleotide synthase [Ignavibacteriales bacterium]
MKKKICIGILGGGQLARMSAFQAYKLGFDIAILEKQMNSPAGQLTKNEFVGWVDDEAVLKKFADRSDIITLENEFIDHSYLEKIERWGKEVIPSSKTISLIQDKYVQKSTLRKNNIPVADFNKVSFNTPYKKIKKQLGEKFLLKSRTMGYDGYGNALVNNEMDLSNGYNKLLNRNAELYAERFVEFEKELAVMVVRTKTQTKVYPVAETIHKNHILHIVKVPAVIEKKILNIAKEIAVESVEAVKGFGLFGIELFVENKNILVNEMAPRPHNSGHYTIEACTTSQFENHIRAVLNLPPGSTEMVKPFAVMINLLGKRNDKGIAENYESVLSDPDAHLHIYGKELSRFGRKMGHITFTGNDPDKLLKKAVKAEKLLII